MTTWLSTADVTEPTPFLGRGFSGASLLACGLALKVVPVDVCHWLWLFHQFSGSETSAGRSVSMVSSLVLMSFFSGSGLTFHQYGVLVSGASGVTGRRWDAANRRSANGRRTYI